MRLPQPAGPGPLRDGGERRGRGRGVRARPAAPAALPGLPADGAPARAPRLPAQPQALAHEPGTLITSTGALATVSGALPMLGRRSSGRPPPRRSGTTAATARSLDPPRPPALTRPRACTPPATGAKTGRSPRDKRVVREPGTEKDVWWAATGSGSPNYEMDER